MSNIQDHLFRLYNQKLMPRAHVNYLRELQAAGINPKVIYDIGACVLHWYREVLPIWPTAQYFVFDANKSCEFLYKKHNLPSHIGVLSNENNNLVDFYSNDLYPGGCSYYRENKNINSPAGFIYTDNHKVQITTRTLDSVVTANNWPLPDFMKLDVQGAELDIIMGSPTCVQSCNDIILELQDLDFNLGAPKSKQVIEYMNDIGFDCLGSFSKNRFDMDFHFRKKTQ